MGCASCQQRAHEASLRAAKQKAALENAEHQLARPKSPWFPPLYAFKDEQDPANEFTDPDLQMLIMRIIQFRHENNLPDIPYIQNVVLHYTMMSNPDYLPHIEWYTPNHEVTVSVKQYALSALAYVKAATHSPDNVLVDAEEAERRAAICVNCPRNIPKINGRTKHDPSFAQSRFAQLAQGRTTSLDGMLNLCGVCTCMLTAKIHFTQEFIEDATQQELLRQFTQEYVGVNGKPMQCWIGTAYAENLAKKQGKQHG